MNIHSLFDIKRSNKAHIDSPEQFVVVRDGTVYLRVVGREGAYTVMTATSGEDSGDVPAFGDQTALNEVATRVSQALDLAPTFKHDFHGQPYIEICSCEYLSDAYRAAESFFSLLDDLESAASTAATKSNDRRQEILADLAELSDQPSTKTVEIWVQPLDEKWSDRLRFSDSEMSTAQPLLSELFALMQGRVNLTEFSCRKPAEPRRSDSDDW